MLNIRSAVILCGGRGTRLGNLEKNSKDTYQGTRKRNFMVYY